jgi:hypothetical protein
MEEHGSNDRERHGFSRTRCACAFCQAPCRHVPGALDPADLSVLCPPSQDLLAWAERHLRALTDKSYPILVPARRDDGACHWYFDGRCAVHHHAPYSCAFFDAHQPQPEIDRRVEATVRAIRDDLASEGPYYRVWCHLCRKGLVGPPGDRAGLRRDVDEIRRRAEGRRRRSAE